MSRRILRPAHGVNAVVSRAGELELYSPQTGEWLLFSAADAARWIALIQDQGDTAAAAARLLRLSNGPPATTSADLEIWIDELIGLGLVRWTSQ